MLFLIILSINAVCNCWAVNMTTNSNKTVLPEKLKALNHVKTFLEDIEHKILRSQDLLNFLDENQALLNITDEMMLKESFASTVLQTITTLFTSLYLRQENSTPFKSEGTATSSTTPITVPFSAVASSDTLSNTIESKPTSNYLNVERVTKRSTKPISNSKTIPTGPKNPIQQNAIESNMVSKQVQVLDPGGIEIEEDSDYKDIFRPAAPKTRKVSTTTAGPTKPDVRNFFSPSSKVIKHEEIVPNPVSDYEDIFTADVNDDKAFLREATTPSTIRIIRKSTITHNYFIGYQTAPRQTEYQPSDLRSELYNEMQRRNAGYFTTGLRKMCFLVSIKDPKDIHEVIKHAPHIIEHMGLSFNEPASAGIRQIAYILSQAPIEDMQSKAVTFENAIAHRKLSFGIEVNLALDFADIIFQKKNGIVLADALADFKDYPKGGLSDYLVCDALIKAFVSPFLDIARPENRDDFVRIMSFAFKGQSPMNNMPSRRLQRGKRSVHRRQQTRRRRPLHSFPRSNTTTIKRHTTISTIHPLHHHSKEKTTSSEETPITEKTTSEEATTITKKTHSEETHVTEKPSASEEATVTEKTTASEETPVTEKTTVNEDSTNSEEIPTRKLIFFKRPTLKRSTIKYRDVRSDEIATRKLKEDEIYVKPKTTKKVTKNLRASPKKDVHKNRLTKPDVTFGKRIKTTNRPNTIRDIHKHTYASSEEVRTRKFLAPNSTKRYTTRQHTHKYPRITVSMEVMTRQLLNMHTLRYRHTRSFRNIRTHNATNSAETGRSFNPYLRTTKHRQLNLFDYMRVRKTTNYVRSNFSIIKALTRRTTEFKTMGKTTTHKSEILNRYRMRASMNVGTSTTGNASTTQKIVNLQTKKRNETSVKHIQNVTRTLIKFKH